MACATLKRSLDWESINQRPTKRRRCSPFGAAAGSTSHHSAAAGCSRVLSEPVPSVFADTSACPKLTPEKMAQNIREEITRLHRSKQLTFSTAAVAAAAVAAGACRSASAATEKMQDSDNSGSEMGPDSPRRAETTTTPQQRRQQQQQQSADKELFSFKQVQLICERMLKEREEFLREQYDTVLTTKLAEQYDAFVKFTYDQIQRRYEAAPSYLS